MTAETTPVIQRTDIFANWKRHWACTPPPPDNHTWRATAYLWNTEQTTQTITAWEPIQ